MAEVIQFPTRSERTLVEMKEIVRNYLLQYVTDIEMIESVSESVAEYNNEFLDKQISLDLGSIMTEDQSEEFQASLKKQLQDIINPIITERIIVEMELYKLRYR